ncbi:hypothetical protein [Ancylobacter defluvii]|uniref:Uncharacterized protein n=1 Tax=Ancylobacter defluvii TaxID=1282440 RepID=A0A9W6NB20_9HYPH|nr:hypothetical protein [Ancylobacter defluvii]MBS7585862.1 hypothetical protein [Ancylobacter defluvii]GLK84238.1 hypothetical protein GCM10017653_23080 [Ancylobacter defluvii]
MTKNIDDAGLKEGQAVTEERQVVESGNVVVQAKPVERQATEVRPMRYVLGIGLLLVIIGMMVTYMSV